MRDAPDLEGLAAAARGGAVAHSAFLSEATSSAWVARLRRDGVAASATGGYPGAARRIVTARGEHVPSADPALAALYLDGAHDASEARAALRAAGAEPGDLGDAVRHADGLSLVVRASFRPQALGAVRLGGREVTPETVPLERAATGTRKTQVLVVPALRADVLGAKALGASRSWFGKGVAAGNVRVDGARVGKSHLLEPGSELWAEGLGRVHVLGVEGETKRGNLKVRVEVEKS